jgi:hypothetical protein
MESTLHLERAVLASWILIFTATLASLIFMQDKVGILSLA